MTGPERLPEPGDVLRVSRAASVQFGSPILFRVIRVHDWTTYHGWIWLDGYELNARGEAVERRSIFVQPAGLRWLKIDVARPRTVSRRPVRMPWPDTPSERPGPSRHSAGDGPGRIS